MTTGSLKVRSPNEEQKRAIFHEGGKLLSAGAGSGKTFVLIEHLVFRLEKIKNTVSSNEWKEKIPSALAQIVLMTFTKKAAGEMSVRLMNKVEALIALSQDEGEERDLAFWQLVHQNLSLLSITTIHGFCHRILRLGTWTKFPQEFDLVSEMEHKDKLLTLFDQWFLRNKDTLDSLILANTPSLQKAMVEIFSSPELRLFWQDPHHIKTADDEINAFFKHYHKLKGFEQFFETEADLSVSEKEKSKKWFECYFEFNALKSEHGLLNASNFAFYMDYFKTIARFPPLTSKEISPEQKAAMEKIKILRQDLKTFGEDLLFLKDHFNVYSKWVLTIADLFRFIDERYLEIDGLSYSDLEFYVLKALEDQDVLKKVQESWSYFIVDEFQDTSFIQFSILKKLTGDDHQKLFCVGDKKQAIYGFRGGELQVFKECSLMLGQENNYFLKNNFRSLPAIVGYNNELFENIFPLGPKFEGQDPHSVEMESQNVTGEGAGTFSGEVLCLKTEVLEAETEIDYDALEAKVLNEHIQSIMLDERFESVCVLYRKLRPSAYLLDLLLLNNIAFSAQVKIQLGDDPVFNLFTYLIQYSLNQKDDKKKVSTLKMLRTLLLILNVQEFKEENLQCFLSDVELFGPQIAFHKFIYALGFANSFHVQNMQLIDAICRLTRGDLVKIYNIISQDDGDNYACEMMSGQAGHGKKRITIMSAHASKGLEFDVVLLGGVHGNGRYNGMKDHIGKFPHSFKWKKSADQKKFFKSPMYYIEAEVSTLKDFSESKRLLYVACTRAVKQLVFVDLWKWHKEEKKELYLYDNSWIQGLRKVPGTIKESQIKGSDEALINISLLQKDHLGLLSNDNRAPLGLIAELSVTRLASLAECPFKFYLQNICKIEAEPTASLFTSDADEEENQHFHSSKKRGTKLHDYLSRLLLQAMSIEEVPAKERQKVQWAFDLAQKSAPGYQIISEQLIKFSFFGQMISATPDLVFLKPDEKIIVWDFKTGLREESSEENYWFQLMCYAYAYVQNARLPEDELIEIALVYLDTQEKISQILSFDEITRSLFNQWMKTERLHQVNTNHCSECVYSAICKKGLAPI